MIERAREKLHELEEQGRDHAGHSPARQIDLFPPVVEHPVLKALEAVQPDELTPRAALETLYRLKAELDRR